MTERSKEERKKGRKEGGLSYHGYYVERDGGIESEKARGIV